MNILIAEDAPVTLKLLASRLKAWGHWVVTAADGDIAWRIVEKESIDIVVSDWMMPGLDGPATLQALQADPDREHARQTLEALQSE